MRLTYLVTQENLKILRKLKRKAKEATFHCALLSVYRRGIIHKINTRPNQSNIFIHSLKQECRSLLKCKEKQSVSENGGVLNHSLERSEQKKLHELLPTRNASTLNLRNERYFRPVLKTKKFRNSFITIRALRAYTILLEFTFNRHILFTNVTDIQTNFYTYKLALKTKDSYF